MMKEDYIRKHFSRMAIHSHSAALGIGRIERLIEDYRLANKHERKRLDVRFHMHY